MRKFSRNELGLTLVEVMVSLVLGSMVTVAVLSTYITVSRNYSQDERYAYMQENGRYALRILTEDLSLADFWGQIVSTDTISTALSPTSGSCGDVTGVFSASDAVRIVNNHVSPAFSHVTSCALVSTNHVANTNVLVIKRVAGSATAETGPDVNDIDNDSNTSEIVTIGASSLSAGTVYLRSNGTVGSLINTASSANPPGNGEGDWQYLPRIYFVRDYLETVGDGIPALCRVALANSTLNDVQCVAEGVEDLHFEYGIDTDDDAVPNIYTTTPTAANMDGLVAVRVHLLMRSAEPDPNYVNNKTYQFGDATHSAKNDGFYRRVYTSTVMVRNSVGRKQFL
ncbi:MAG: PilW family protein [Gammaproteobacteria bacterium]|nr:PilW family protein [Gammaproteobacteria bacterium]